MSIRNGLLALLSQEPMGVYQLRKEFEARTGGTWPLNIGQVYSTMQRLERDGLVTPLDVSGAGDEVVERFGLTGAGRDAARIWWSDPVLRGTPQRDEVVIKLSLAVTVPGVDVRAVVQTQRRETMRALRDYTRLKASGARDVGHPGGDLAWSLVLEHHIFAAEAEVRWLDHIESTVERARSDHAAGSVQHATTTPAGAAGASGETPAAPGAVAARGDTPAGTGRRRTR